MTKEEARKKIENECFVNLIAAAQDDSDLNNRLLTVLRSDDATRQATIKAWVQSCISEGAPQFFTEAISYFYHREIAYAAVRLLV